MQIDDAKVSEVQHLYENIYAVSISPEKARIIARRGLALYDLLLRPLPTRQELLVSNSADPGRQ